MGQWNVAVFTETDKKKVDAILYQAMFDEVLRLRKTASCRERKEIRKFIMEVYRLYVESNFESENQGIFQENTFQKSQEANRTDSTGIGKRELATIIHKHITCLLS